MHIGDKQSKFVIDDPLSLNLYSYTYNNPIMYTDPTGHFVFVIPLITTAPAWVPYVVVGVTAIISAFTVKAIIDSNPKPYKAEASDESEVIVVDPHGNAIPLKPGQTIEGSPDGEVWQVKDQNGKPTGERYDGKGHRNQSDPKAKEPHGHRVGSDGKPITDDTGNPHLPVNPPWIR